MKKYQLLKKDSAMFVDGLVSRIRCHFVSTGNVLQWHLSLNAGRRRSGPPTGSPAHRPSAHRPSGTPAHRLSGTPAHQHSGPTAYRHTGPPDHRPTKSERHHSGALWYSTTDRYDVIQLLLKITSTRRFLQHSRFV
jgi:hypothetical protein